MIVYSTMNLTTRYDGGVARMSDPDMIRSIKAAVTIPVMAKVLHHGLTQFL